MIEINEVSHHRGNINQELKSCRRPLGTRIRPRASCRCYNENDMFLIDLYNLPYNCFLDMKANSIQQIQSESLFECSKTPFLIKLTLTLSVSAGFMPQFSILGRKVIKCHWLIYLPSHIEKFR